MTLEHLCVWIRVRRGGDFSPSYITTTTPSNPSCVMCDTLVNDGRHTVRTSLNHFTQPIHEFARFIRADGTPYGASVCVCDPDMSELTRVEDE